MFEFPLDIKTPVSSRSHLVTVYIVYNDHRHHYYDYYNFLSEAMFSQL